MLSHTGCFRCSQYCTWKCTHENNTEINQPGITQLQIHKKNKNLQKQGTGCDVQKQRTNWIKTHLKFKNILLLLINLPLWAHKELWINIVLKWNIELRKIISSSFRMLTTNPYQLDSFLFILCNLFNNFFPQSFKSACMLQYWLLLTPRWPSLLILYTKWICLLSKKGLIAFESCLNL